MKALCCAAALAAAILVPGSALANHEDVDTARPRATHNAGRSVARDDARTTQDHHGHEHVLKYGHRGIMFEGSE